MNFQQLRAVHETARLGYRLTEAAELLQASQSGVSRQVRELEEELGVEIFQRQGKRLTGLTTPGTVVVPIVDRLVAGLDALAGVGAAFRRSPGGPLSIAATHSQSRYALPDAVRRFRAAHPAVRLHLHQGTPKQVAEMLQAGEADIGIATEVLSRQAQLVVLPCREWSHAIVVPEGHPLLARQSPPTLHQLAEWPLVTYDVGYTGRSVIDEAFAAAGLRPEIVIAAMDADVIKTYVEQGIGVGIVASIACESRHGERLRSIDAAHLFAPNITRLALRRGCCLRDYAFDFITAFAPALTRAAVEPLLREPRDDD